MAMVPLGLTMQLEIEGICLFLNGGTCMIVLPPATMFGNMDVVIGGEHFFHREIHSVKRNKLIVNQSESLVYVHYNCDCCPITVRSQRWIKHLRLGTTIQKRTIWRMEYWF
jgi:hypothetical protein